MKQPKTEYPLESVKLHHIERIFFLTNEANLSSLCVYKEQTVWDMIIIRFQCQQQFLYESIPVI